MSQVTVTTKASEKIKQFIKDDEDGGQYLRMYVQGGGCSGLSYGMGLEKEPEEDHTDADAGLWVVGAGDGPYEMMLGGGP